MDPKASVEVDGTQRLLDLPGLGLLGLRQSPFVKRVEGGPDLVDAAARYF